MSSIPTTYRDLKEFGVQFITPEDAEFSRLVQQIQNRPNPIGPKDSVDPDLPSAVLLNQSGKAIIALSYLWKYTTADGHVRTSRTSNLGSSAQMEVLTGQAEVAKDRFNFILSGSKRLITESGMFGDNSDVLPREPETMRGHIVGEGGGGVRHGPTEQIKAIELSLDVVFFEDGLCVGPDERGLFESITVDLQQQRNIARDIVELLRRDESVGRAFEILRQLARDTRPPRQRHRGATQLLSIFANTAIHMLVHREGEELLAWFEGIAAPARFSLHRPQ